MKAHKGFTLIELVVVVVIIAILATIAIPSYSQYITRSNRRAAQAVMMEIATREMQYFAPTASSPTRVTSGTSCRRTWPGTTRTRSPSTPARRPASRSSLRRRRTARLPTATWR